MRGQCGEGQGRFGGFSMGKDEAGPSLNRIKGYILRKGNRETRPYLSNTDGVG